VPFFGEFLELHGKDYRGANPNDWSRIGVMTRKLMSGSMSCSTRMR
jgi:hypothetical protein